MFQVNFLWHFNCKEQIWVEEYETWLNVLQKKKLMLGCVEKNQE
jgi:hypothetical protein